MENVSCGTLASEASRQVDAGVTACVECTLVSVLTSPVVSQQHVTLPAGARVPSIVVGASVGATAVCCSFTFINVSAGDLVFFQGVSLLTVATESPRQVDADLRTGKLHAATATSIHPHQTLIHVSTSPVVLQEQLEALPAGALIASLTVGASVVAPSIVRGNTLIDV